MHTNLNDVRGGHRSPHRLHRSPVNLISVSATRCAPVCASPAGHPFNKTAFADDHNCWLTPQTSVSECRMPLPAFADLRAPARHATARREIRPCHRQFRRGSSVQTTLIEARLFQPTTVACCARAQPVCHPAARQFSLYSDNPALHKRAAPNIRRLLWSRTQALIC